MNTEVLTGMGFSPAQITSAKAHCGATASFEEMLNYMLEQADFQPTSSTKKQQPSTGSASHSTGKKKPSSLQSSYNKIKQQNQQLSLNSQSSVGHHKSVHDNSSISSAKQSLAAQREQKRRANLEWNLRQQKKMEDDVQVSATSATKVQATKSNSTQVPTTVQIQTNKGVSNSTSYNPFANSYQQKPSSTQNNNTGYIEPHGKVTILKRQQPQATTTMTTKSVLNSNDNGEMRVTSKVFVPGQGLVVADAASTASIPSMTKTVTTYEIQSDNSSSSSHVADSWPETNNNTIAPLTNLLDSFSLNAALNEESNDNNDIIGSSSGVDIWGNSNGFGSQSAGNSIW